MRTPDPRVVLEALEAITEAFVTIDEDHRVVFFNRAAEQLFGVNRADVLDKDLNLILTPDCSRDHQRAVRRYLEIGVPRKIGHEAELIVTRKNGEKVPVAVSFSVTKNGDRVYFTGLMRDMTEGKALQEQAARAETLATLGRFVAEITHEIRNQLMIIGINVHQLQSRFADENSQTKLAMVEDEVKRLETLLAELNVYYRPRNLVYDVFDAGLLLQEVCLLAKAESESRSLVLECRLDPKPAWVRGDRNGLKEVLINLVQNAVEALSSGGHLFIRSETTDRLDIKVVDDGPGIPKEYQEKIFTPFFTTKSRGSGLGLAISKRIIDAHPGGSLQFMSQAHGGTAFQVSLLLVPIEDEA